MNGSSTRGKGGDSKPLTILSIAYPFAPVGRDAVGGAEQVLASIDCALVTAGHRSIVIASKGSTVAGELITCTGFNGPSLEQVAIAAQHARVSEATRQVLSDTSIDVVHMHGIDFYLYLPAPGPPVLATLHLPLSWYPPHALAPDRPGTWVNCVSEAQRAGAEPNDCMLPVIGNGVPVAELGNDYATKREYALMLARICPEKGQHLALQAAHLIDYPLIIGGEIFPHKQHQHYFDTQVRPLLDARRRYFGPIGFERKRGLLARAACLLIPSLVAETSSLVAMEAASCGTPVIAFRAGALPEVVEQGVTGLIVDDVAAMASAIGQSKRIDPLVCRAVAAKRFSVEKMTEAYMDCYSKLATTVAQAA